MTCEEIKKDLINAESKTLAEEAAKLLIEKKAHGVTMFCVKDHTSITDYYVNATAKSSTHVNALADELADNLQSRGSAPLRVEGRSGKSWILVDFGNVIVNIFDAQTREFYNFDRFLPAECAVDITPLVKEVDKKYE